MIFGRGNIALLRGDLLTRAINWDDPSSTPPNRKPEVVFLIFSLFFTLPGRIFQLSLLTRKGNVLSSHEHHRRSKPQFWMPITSSIVNTSVATTILGQCKREVTTYSKKSLPTGMVVFNGNWNGMSGPKCCEKTVDPTFRVFTPHHL